MSMWITDFAAMLAAGPLRETFIPYDLICYFFEFRSLVDVLIRGNAGGGIREMRSDEEAQRHG